MYFFQSVVAALWAGSAYAASTPSPLSLHEKRNFVPSGWVKRSVAPRDMSLPVRIGITQRNAHLGHDMLMDISDPDSPNYGKHWTPEEVADFFSPEAETVDAVREWLSQSGIESSRHTVAGSRGHLQFAATIEEIESLLGNQYEIWEHTESGDLTISCEEYHVPHHVKHHIDFVTPTIGFDIHNAPGLRKLRRRDAEETKLRNPMLYPVPDERLVNAAPLANCDLAITPPCVKALYDIPATTKAVKGGDLGIYEEGDTYDQKDLNLFFSNFAPNIPKGTSPILQSIDGGKAPVKTRLGGGESALDFQLAFPIVYPQGIKLYQTFDRYTAARTLGIFNPFLDALDGSYCTFEGGDQPPIDPTFPDGHGYNRPEQCGVYKPTDVISISYQLAEAAYPPAYEMRQCQEYMKLGLQGTSIIFSSGDNGTVSRAGKPGCLSGGRDNPGFPSTCPYVTSVGATQIKKGNTVDDPEEAVDPNNQFFFSSGGGFSNVFAQPSYQSAAVAAFLKTGNLPPAKNFNKTGRAFPDVAANGWNITVFVGGQEGLEAGTSASAPIFASIVNRLNAARISAGKKPVGFLNPTLYKNPSAFNDITTGYNLGCNLVPAFNATKGWDPVTGLGTPNYPKLLSVFMALP